eukprot:11292467-Ditylum_brightwellii.AAC.1
MPHCKGYIDVLVKYIQKQNNITNKLKQYMMMHNTTSNIYPGLHYIVSTTFGSIGLRAVESAENFEVAVADE